MIRKKFKKFTAICLAVVMTFSMAGCEKGQSSSAKKEEQEKFDQWLQESFEESVTSDTITLHYSLAHPEDYGITPPEVTLGEFDLSEEAIAEDIADIKEDMAEMEAFDYDLLTKDQQFSYDVLYELLKTNLLSYDYPYLYEPLAYTSGLQTNYPITLSEYTFYDQQDVDDYIALLNLTPDYFQACLDFEVEKSERGYFMSDANADEVIRQCEEYIANPEENLLIATFNDRIGDVPGLTSAQIEDYKQANYDAVMDCIIPSYENVISTMTKLKGTGTNTQGLYHYEDGLEYYEYLIDSNVGTDKSAEELKELLDDEISETLGELMGLASFNYEAYMGYIEDYESFYQGLDHAETIKYFEKMSDEKFPDIPDINFTVTPVHKSLEDIVSPAFYMTPPMDDYENNSIYINEGTDSANALWGTLAHEGIPGHMYQFVYFLSNDPEPIRTLLNFKGYQEGWATYVEMMSYDYYEDYEDETYAAIERINSELNLLVSARVDVGIHYEGWTLEDTKNYLETSGFDPNAAEEIYNYIVADPCLYPAYCVGWLEFEELKEYAEDKLGDDFDEVEFHKVVLDAGPCQFYLLKNLVEDYVKENK